MSVRDEFLVLLRRRQLADPAPFPDLLAASAAEALGADAGSICLLQPFLRLPIGASAGAAQAEQVQATFGGGPGVDSDHRAGDVALDEAELSGRWPFFHHCLTRRTPYRSVLSVPLVRGGGVVFAALDLYTTRSTWGAATPARAARTELGGLVSMLLIASASGGQPFPDAADGWARRRRQSWVAVGMLCEAAGLTEADALAVLRAHACSTDRLLDDLADDLVRGRLALRHVVDA